jgi:predicted neuraminidase
MSSLHGWPRRQFLGFLSSIAAMGSAQSIVQRALALPLQGETWPGEVRREFIYETAPFPECHASTIVETPSGMFCSWFGGTEEKHPDVGIWTSRLTSSGWSTPVEVANGVWSDGKRYPTWNPVLFQFPEGPLALYYKVGPDPASWWGMQMFSHDEGKTWSKPEQLPEGILGPIRNKPVLLRDGSLLCGSSTEHDGWRLHMERTKDKGKTWERIAPEEIRGEEAIQPTILSLGGDSLVILNRARRAGKILASRSDDLGKTWSKLAPLHLPNNNSGIDAVTTRSGKHYLVYNHTPRGRTPLCVAVSDDATTWKPVFVLEQAPGEYSYPAIIEGSDGLLHITYTWKREKIAYVVLDPTKLVAREYVNGEWPR